MNDPTANDQKIHSPANAEELATPKDDRPMWRKAMPFVMAIGLLCWIGTRLNLRLFVRDLSQVNYPLFLGFCAIFMLALLLADSVATAYVYKKTICPISVREFFLVRGASYLPSLANHHLGQAWLTWYISRAYRAPLGQVAGATLLVYATTFGALLLFGALSLIFDPSPSAWLLPGLAAVAVAGCLYLAVIKIAPARLAKNRVLGPLFQAGVRGHMEALALRIPHVFVQFMGLWVPFYFFGVKIPLSAALAYLPVLMVIVVLPITPQGVGTRDWFCMRYFSVFAVGELAERNSAIVASTLSFVAGISVVQAILALILMPRALKAIRRADATNRNKA